MSSAHCGHGMLILPAQDTSQLRRRVKKEDKSMPFIDSRITMKVSDAQKENYKARLGKAVSLLGKPESYLMVGIAEDYDLYLAGKKLDKGAYVEVSLFGQASSEAFDRMTGEICKALEEEMGIPGDKVYVKYHGVKDWGWNGSNF